MDQKDFIPIGIIKVLWNFDIINKIKDAYFEFYVPKKIEYKYGNMYCNRFVFLENNVAYKVETNESLKLNFEQLDYNKKSNLFKIKLIDNIIFLNEEQLKIIKNNININKI